MKLEECVDDPQFRKAFVEYEISALQRVISGNENMIYHNKGKHSILKEIQNKLELNDDENDVISEHLTAINTVNLDIEKQNAKLKIMIDIYKKFIDKSGKKGNLKLA